MKSLLLTSSLVLALLGAYAKAYAQPHVQDVPSRLHPSLASTQNAIRRAIQQMIAAQQARQGALGVGIVRAQANMADLKPGFR